MVFSAVPALIPAIVDAAAAALPDVWVADGLAVTDNPGTSLMIGVTDPFSDEPQDAAETEKDFATPGLDGSHDESGEITCAVVSWSGDREMGPTRDDAYSVADVVDELCRIKGGTDPAFGVDCVLWTRMGSRAQLWYMDGEEGVAAVLIFRIYFQARL